MVAVSPAIASAADLVRSLQAESDAFLDFTQTLRIEQEALIQGEVDQLLELARVKSEKIVLLSQLAERRNRFLTGLGYDPLHGGMERWISQHAQDAPEIGKSWNNLLENAREARHLNQTNGVMIETRLQHNQQALSALQAASSQISLYGPDGQTQSTGLGRPLGKV